MFWDGHSHVKNTAQETRATTRKSENGENEETHEEGTNKGTEQEGEAGSVCYS
jgi:hypothetical protein